MTVVFVGQAPARTALARRAFSGQTASGRFLASLCGAPDCDALRTRVRLVNLVARYHGPASGKGDAFDLARARRGARRVLAALPGGATVVCLGRKVWTAFGLAPASWWQTVPLGGATFLLMPHPSRVSHYWNDQANVRRARSVLSSLVGAVAWPREQRRLELACSG